MLGLEGTARVGVATSLALALLAALASVPRRPVLAGVAVAALAILMVVGLPRPENLLLHSAISGGRTQGELFYLGVGRSATVTADTPLRLLVIQRRDFATLLREAPDLTQSLLATLSRRVRQAEQVVSG